ncbi:MAG: 6-carboxytetrahydropterin synthase QueD [Candidatus Brocadiia bacterium]
MYRISVEKTFASAHRLRIEGHKCENLHGHNWRVILTVQGNVLDEFGMLVDFHILKALLSSEVEIFDHRYLNECPPFDQENPTTENLCRHLANAISPRLPKGVSVHSVTVHESEGSIGSYIIEQQERTE